MSATTNRKPPNAGKGRPKGSVNKLTADIRALAQEHGPEAIHRLVEIMQTSENDQASIAAAKELLDRAYGKSKQQVETEVTGSLSIQKIVREIVDPKD